MPPSGRGRDADFIRRQRGAAGKSLPALHQGTSNGDGAPLRARRGGSPDMLAALRQEFTFDAARAQHWQEDLRRKPTLNPLASRSLAPPLPYPAMRTVVASSPPPLLSEPKAIETGVKAPLAAMNQLSLGFASALQALAQQPTQASAAGKLAQLWARAMDAMVTAVERAGASEARLRARCHELEEEVATQARAAELLTREKRMQLEETHRLRSELTALNTRWMVLAHNQAHLLNPDDVADTLAEEDPSHDRLTHLLTMQERQVAPRISQASDTAPAAEADVKSPVYVDDLIHHHTQAASVQSQASWEELSGDVQGDARADPAHPSLRPQSPQDQPAPAPAPRRPPKPRMRKMFSMVKQAQLHLEPEPCASVEVFMSVLDDEVRVTLVPRGDHVVQLDDPDPQLGIDSWHPPDLDLSEPVIVADVREETEEDTFGEGDDALGNQNAVAHLDPATPAESDAAMSSQSGAARPMRDVASGEQSASGGPPNQSTSAVLKDPKLGATSAEPTVLSGRISERCAHPGRPSLLTAAELATLDEPPELLVLPYMPPARSTKADGVRSELVDKGTQVDLDEEEGLRILRRRDQRVQTRVASGRPGQVSGHVSGHVSGDYGSGVVSSYRRSARASHARPALAEGNGDTKDSFGGGPKSATIVKGAGGLHEGVLSGHGHVAANAPEVMALVPLHQHIVLILLDLVDLRPQMNTGELYVGTEKLASSESSQIRMSRKRLLTAAADSTQDAAWHPPPMQEFAYEWFLRLHGSKTLATRQHATFVAGLLHHHLHSPLVHTFARGWGLFDHLKPQAWRFLCAVVSHVLTCNDPQSAWLLSDSFVPMLSVVHASEKLELTFTSMGHTAPAQMMRALMHAAVSFKLEEQRRPMVDLGVVLDVALIAWTQHLADSSNLLTSAFLSRYPRGTALLHYDKFSALVKEVAPECPASVISRMFREASTSVSGAGDDDTNTFTAEKFLQVAESHEVLGWRATRSIPKTASRTEILPEDLIVSMSLKLLEYSWGCVKSAIQLWMKRWRSFYGPGASLVHSSHNDARLKDLELASKLETSVTRAEKAMHDAQEHLNKKLAGQGMGIGVSIDYAWHEYSRSVCELEEHVLTHRDSIGITDVQVEHTAAALWAPQIQTRVWEASC